MSVFAQLDRMRPHVSEPVTPRVPAPVARLTLPPVSAARIATRTSDNRFPLDTPVQWIDDRDGKPDTCMRTWGELSRDERKTVMADPANGMLVGGWEF